MIFEFLKMVYFYPDELDEQPESFYSRCLDEVLCHGVAVQIYGRLKALNKLALVPDGFRTVLHEKSVNALGQNIYVKRHLQSICTALDKAEVAAIPIKGVRLAEVYFGGLDTRPTADIDILIQRGDLLRATNVLVNLGYLPPEPSNPQHFHCLMRPSRERERSLVTVELHWNLTFEKRAAINLGILWDNATFLEPYSSIRELSVQHTFYALCLHGSNHQMDALKYVLDIVQLIVQFGNQINFMDLFEQADRDKTFRRVYATLRYIYDLLPELTRVKPLPTMAKANRIPFLRVGTPQLFLLDSWLFRYRLIMDTILPPRDVALWYMRTDPKVSRKNVHFRFYQRRLRKLLHRLELNRGDEDRYA